jgi:hypothetical protein
MEVFIAQGAKEVVSMHSNPSEFRMTVAEWQAFDEDRAPVPAPPKILTKENPMEWFMENDKWWGYGKWLVDTDNGEEWNVRAAGPSVILATYPTLEEAKAKVEELEASLLSAPVPAPRLEHVLELRDDGWSLEHPQVCRESKSLLDCPVHAVVKSHEDEMELWEHGRFNVGLDEYGELEKLSSAPPVGTQE